MYTYGPDTLKGGERMPETVNIALIQFESVLGDTVASTAKAVKMCTEAAEKGAGIICLPELFSTGYNLDLIGSRIPELAQTVDGPTITALREVSRTYSCCIIAPIALIKEIPSVAYNSAVVMEDGEILGVYDKNHLWALERFFFRPGQSYPVFDTKYGRIGVMICYDMGFPEVPRILTLKGCEMIFCPSAWRILDRDMWNINIPQRALENNLFVAGINRYGREADLYMDGATKIANPRGHIIAEIKEEKEDILYCTIDKSEITELRATSMYLHCRRPEQYGLLTEQF